PCNRGQDGVGRENAVSNPWIVSALLLAFPTLFGALCGTELRRFGIPGWAGLFAVLFSPLLALLADWLLLGFWDLGLIGLIFGTSVWIYLSAKDAFPVAVAVIVTVVLGLLAVEATTRALLSEPWTPNAHAWPHLTQETLRQPLSRGEIPRMWPAPMDSWPH